MLCYVLSFFILSTYINASQGPTVIAYKKTPLELTEEVNSFNNPFLTTSSIARNWKNLNVVTQEIREEDAGVISDTIHHKFHFFDNQTEKYLGALTDLNNYKHLSEKEIRNILTGFFNR